MLNKDSKDTLNTDPKYKTVPMKWNNQRYYIRYTRMIKILQNIKESRDIISINYFNPFNN